MSNSTYFDNLLNQRPFGWEFTETFHFGFEELEHPFWYQWVISKWRWAIYGGLLYVLVIFGLQRWMRDRKPFELKWPLFWWNLSLGIFSIVGFARTLPGFLNMLAKEDGFYQSICVKKHLDVPTTFWSLLFICSKYVEFGDTVFIILRKRPLAFIQWYHHLVTMIVTWTVAPQSEPISRWWMILNFGVHSLMYPYFAARAAGKRVPAPVANLITTLQLAQMIAGFIINFMSLYYLKSQYGCDRYPASINAITSVYGSFLFLFGKLFYDSVVKKGRLRRDKLGGKLE